MATAAVNVVVGVGQEESNPRLAICGAGGQVCAKPTLRPLSLRRGQNGVIIGSAWSVLDGFLSRSAVLR